MGQVIRTDSDAAGQKAITITLNENKELIDEQLVTMQALLTQARVLNIYKAHENDFIVDSRMFTENNSE